MMRQLLPIFLVFCAQASADTFYVCVSGTMENGQACTHNTLQAAVDAANNGDTIIARSGDSFQQILIPRGRRNLTIKSSQIDNYPRGYRITRNHPALARIATIYSYEAAVQIGQDEWWAFPAAGGGENLLTFNWFHRWPVGTQVTVLGQMFTPYYCSAAGVAPFGADCPTGSAGFFFLRGNVGLANGKIVYFSSVAGLPSPLQPDTPYYIVGLTANRFQISDTPGGTPLTLTGYSSAKPLMMEYPLAPIRNNEVLYVVGVGNGKQVQLSRTRGGDPITFTQAPSRVTVTQMDAVRDFTLDGFEVTTATNAVKPYYLINVPNNVQRQETEGSGIRILRCWVHPRYLQTPMPNQGILLGARDSEVGYSIVEDIWSNQADTQAVYINSRGNVWIHDNELSATGESIMSGGNFPTFYPEGTNGIRIERNYFRKPLSWFSGIVAKKVNANTFRLVTRAFEDSCATRASDTALYNRCFWYDGSETTGWNRRELTEDLTISFNVPASKSGVLYVYGEDGQIKIRHNLGDAPDTVNCPATAVLDCEFMATPVFPITSSRHTIVTVTNGAVIDSLWFENKPANVKNAIESKRGDNWLIEGNVMHRQFYPIIASITQDMFINVTNAVNDSNPMGPADGNVSSSYITIRNNIFRHASKGVISNGKAVGLPEWTFGRTIGNRLENNLFFDLGSSEWSSTDLSGMAMIGNNSEWAILHNTAIDTRWALAGDRPTNSVLYASNIVVPPAADNPGAQRFTTRYPEIRDQNHSGYRGWSAVLGYWADPQTSNFTRNYLHVRGTAVIPSGYVTQDSYMQSPGMPLTNVFRAWAERPANDWNGAYVRQIDARLTPSFAQTFRAADGRTLGADIDEIEAFTGVHGADVEAGIPTFAERSARQITPGSLSAVLSYQKGTSSCAIRLWDNLEYAGTPIADVTDDSITAEEGRLSITLTGLAPSTYYFGKRWCGTEVDVFRFATTSETPQENVALAAPANAAECLVEHGPTSALGAASVAVPVVDGTCSISVPSSAVFWRHVYRNASGEVVSRGTVKKRAF